MNTITLAAACAAVGHHAVVVGDGERFIRATLDAMPDLAGEDVAS